MSKSKKRFISFILVISVLMLFLSGCGKVGIQNEEIDQDAYRNEFIRVANLQTIDEIPGVKNENILETQDNLLISVNYPVIEANAEVSGAIEAQVKASLQTFMETAEALQSSSEKQDNIPVCEYRLTYKPYLTPGNILSVKFSKSEYAGETDITNSIESFVYNLLDSSRLTLTDVFNTNVDYLGRISELTKDSLLKNEVQQKNMDEALFSAGTAPEEQNFSNFALTADEQILFFFDHGQVAPGEAGSFEIAIPLSSLSDVADPEKLAAIYGTGGTPLTMVDGQDEPQEGIYQTQLETLQVEGNDMPPKSIDGIDVMNDKVVALTFDDGPSKYTEGILDELEAVGGCATFYVVGENAERYPEILKRIYSSTSELGNHSYNHPHFDTISIDSVVSDQVGKTNDIIEAATGKRTITVRPPGGAINEEIASAIGRTMIMWNVDTRDWEGRSEHSVAEKAQMNLQAVIDGTENGTKDGCIILLHDIHEPTAASAPDIIRFLSDSGYKFVTITQLMQIAEARGQEIGYRFYNAEPPTASTPSGNDPDTGTAEGETASSEPDNKTEE